MERPSPHQYAPLFNEDTNFRQQLPQSENVPQIGYPTNPYPPAQPGQPQDYNPALPAVSLLQERPPRRLMVGFHWGAALLMFGGLFLINALVFYLRSRGGKDEHDMDTISLVLMLIGLILLVPGIVVTVHFYRKLEEYKANAPPMTTVTVPIPSFPMYSPSQITQQPSQGTGPSLYPRQNYRY